MKKYLSDNFKHFLHGGDYNPEQWMDTKEIWDDDMALMKSANCNEMTVGVFSWSKLEPQEGVYDFTWLDEILDKIYANGGRVMLATPSGAKPHWMADKYPEILRVDKNGQRNAFGRRHNHCYTSPYYRKKVYEMNSLLAGRYGSHPAVLGWHISNEYGGECYCPLCKAAFKKWLNKKYGGDIEKLNFEWWTTFWSHTYDSFEQVDPPSPHGDSFSGLELDWKRFVSEQTADFIANEVRGVRTHSDLFVTTNLMGYYTQLDYNVLEKQLDVISWDSYPEWHITEGGKDNVSMAIETALVHDSYRALKQRPFMLMESTPSNTNWHRYNKLKKPGMHMLASLQAVAHGSDTVQYFQWRKSRGSNEKFHGAVVDHVGSADTRVFKEVAEVGSVLQKIEGVLGCMPNVKVALIMDVQNMWGLTEAQGFINRDKKYEETCKIFYSALWEKSIDVDVIDSHRDLTKYDLVILPMLYMTDKATIDNIEAFVRNGGTAVATYMLGMVNENDLCYLGGFPGDKLKKVFGIWAEEIDTLYPDDSNRIAYNGQNYEVVDYCERIHPDKDTQVLGVYKEDFYSGEPALTKHRYGEGTAYYISARDRGELTRAIIGNILKDLKIAGSIQNTPYGVSAHTREDGEYVYTFVGNYDGQDKEVDIGTEKDNLISGAKESGTVHFKPYEMKVYRNKKN